MAPAPSGSLVFAVTSRKSCQGQNPRGSQLALWRSDDGGAHWSQVGDLPATSSQGLLVVDAGGGNGGLLLYQAPSLRVSSDGGKTWTQAPTTGVPVTPDAPMSPPLGTLGDGSVVMGQFVTSASSNGPTTTTTTLYAWKAGDAAWRQISGPLDHQLTSLLVDHSGNGSDGTLWAVAQTGGQTGQNGALTNLTYGVFRHAP